jgi:hypothetical protein
MSLVANHVIFSHEKACDAYASCTAQLDMRVTLSFLLFNFSNKEQWSTYLSWSEFSLTTHMGLNKLVTQY